MRFGISATSWIFPKNLRTRLRPVNVCAISSLLALPNRRAGTTLRKAAIHRDRQDRRRGPLFYAIRTRPNRPTVAAARRRYWRFRGTSPQNHRFVFPYGRDSPVIHALLLGIPGSRYARPGISLK